MSYDLPGYDRIYMAEPDFGDEIPDHIQDEILSLKFGDIIEIFEMSEECYDVFQEKLETVTEKTALGLYHEILGFLEKREPDSAQTLKTVADRVIARHFTEWCEDESRDAFCD